MDTRARRAAIAAAWVAATAPGAVHAELRNDLSYVDRDSPAYSRYT